MVSSSVRPGAPLAVYLGMPTMIALESELATMKQSLKRQQCLTALVVVVLFGVAALGATNAGPEVLRAERIEIVDRDGRVAASLVSHANGGGVLSLFDRVGNRRAVITAADGGKVALKSSDGEDVLYLGENAGRGAGIIELLNQKGQVAVQVTADTRGRGYVGVFDQLGIGKTLEPQPSDALGSRLLAGKDAGQPRE